jgi:hypothetical protein
MADLDFNADDYSADLGKADALAQQKLKQPEPPKGKPNG